MSDGPAAGPPPGWYFDGQVHRWWTGAAWTPHTAPGDAPPPDRPPASGPSAARVLGIVTAAVLGVPAVVVLAVYIAGSLFG